jgi:hypothetical protein
VQRAAAGGGGTRQDKTVHYISPRGGEFEVFQLSGRTSIALMNAAPAAATGLIT